MTRFSGPDWEICSSFFARAFVLISMPEERSTASSRSLAENLRLE
jgi:hypothetical protein